MTAVLALTASILWGIADFMGGTLSRRLSTVVVVGVSQGFALLGLVVVVVATRAYDGPLGYLPWALAAGVIGFVALSAFYLALAIGTMGVVAPIAATGVALPVVIGLVSGEAPSVLQLLGIAVAAVGVVLASGPELRGGRGGPRALGLAAVAAVGFGLVMVLIAKAAEHGTVMTLATMRATSVVLLGLVAVAAMWRSRARTVVTRADLAPLAAVGAGDVLANAGFAVASQSGLLAVVAVLSSLYPAVTVLLARRIHDESLRPLQTYGVVAALGGVVLIAAGGGTG